jgi:hypothetical protein
MATLKEFIQSGRAEVSPNLPVSSERIETVLAKYAQHDRHITRQASTELAKVLGSDSFLTKLSEEVGRPLPGETRSQFIERACDTLRRLLRELFRL